MAEKLNKYFQFYNPVEKFHSKPMSLRHLMLEISSELVQLDINNQINFNINIVELTEQQFKKGELHYDA